PPSIGGRQRLAGGSPGGQRRAVLEPEPRHGRGRGRGRGPRPAGHRGVAGLVAGACSMALGEWVSVTSSRDLAQREIRIETGELTEDPEGEGDELKLIYEARGLSPGEADTMVKHLLADRSSAIDALAREELGIDPTQLGGSAWEAALTSF